MFGAQEFLSDFVIIPRCSINQTNKIWVHFQEQLLLRHSFSNTDQIECVDCHLFGKNNFINIRRSFYNDKVIPENNDKVSRGQFQYRDSDIFCDR